MWSIFFFYNISLVKFGLLFLNYTNKLFKKFSLNMLIYLYSVSDNFNIFCLCGSDSAGCFPAETLS